METIDTVRPEDLPLPRFGMSNQEIREKLVAIPHRHPKYDRPDACKGCAWRHTILVLLNECTALRETLEGRS